MTQFATPPWAQRVHEFVREGFAARPGSSAKTFPTHSLFGSLRATGTEIWLDTGDLDEARALWSREMTALTTNNSLLNKEIQKGTYDALIPRAAAVLDGFEMTDAQRKGEIAFILNAIHALKLVDAFDAMVSVEEHTDLAHDVDQAVAFGRRYHAICPERFIIKIPFTPAGILATRRLSQAGIPVNHTLGFSARQNYAVTRIASPSYVNVFLGRLNSVVADNGIGDGKLVGEKALLASQATVLELRETYDLPTRQIAASMRAGEQVQALAGCDVMTMPTKVARQFAEAGLTAEDLSDRTGEDYQPQWDAAQASANRVETLFAVDDLTARAVDALLEEDLDAMTADGLVRFFADNGCGDLLPLWTPDQVRRSAEDGKIPNLSHWREELDHKIVGLDSLMNLAGLNAFTADQQAMDQRVARLLT